MSDQDHRMVQTETKPTPDPTVLTTEQLLREIGRVEALVRSEIEGDRKTNNAKFEAFDKLRDTKVAAIQEINAVRFTAIERDFAAIEAWRKEQKVDTKTAVDAALTAASTAVREQTAAGEKAIAKSEASASEQGKLQAATFAAELKGISIVVADVKDRITKIEASKLGAADYRVENRQSNAAIWVVVGGLVGLVFLIIAIASLILNAKP